MEGEEKKIYRKKYTNLKVKMTATMKDSIEEGARIAGEETVDDYVNKIFLFIGNKSINGLREYLKKIVGD
jgi:hypothetical protein